MDESREVADMLLLHLPRFDGCIFSFGRTVTYIVDGATPGVFFSEQQVRDTVSRARIRPVYSALSKT